MTANLPKFFKSIEETYKEAASSIKHLLEEGDSIYTSHLEINFVLMLIAKLRLDFKHDNTSTREVLAEMLKGGHLKFNDDGLFYKELVLNFKTGLQARYSSHHSIEQQYSLSGPVVQEILIGVSQDKEGNTTTWLQFERHNTKTIIDLIFHMLDYLMYKLTGKNMGPFGESLHTDQNPLIIKPA